MDKNCPKCGKKLSVFYMKPNCPGCGCNFMSYNVNERLEADAEKAEAEYAALEALINKVLPKKIKELIEKKKGNKE